MKYIFSKLKKNDTSNVILRGNSLDLLSMVITICCSVGNSISKEKGISYDNAIKLIVESIQEGYKSVK